MARASPGGGHLSSSVPTTRLGGSISESAALSSVILSRLPLSPSSLILDGRTHSPCRGTVRLQALPALPSPRPQSRRSWTSSPHRSGSSEPYLRRLGGMMVISADVALDG